MALTKCTSNNEINLLEMLSITADSCARGCQVILAVNKKREQQKKDPDDDDTIDVKYKVADDPRSALTEADLNSQLVIMNCIRSIYGSDLNIIGEEDSCESNESSEDNASEIDMISIYEKYNVDSISKRAINKTLLNDCVDEYFDRSKFLVPLKDLTVYIDPMDGTREFVEGRLQNVQCLIGITYKGQPVAGVIGLPFASFDEADDSISICCSMNLYDSKIIDMVRFQNRVCQCDRKYQNSWQKLGECDGSPSNDMKSSLKVFTGDSSRIHKKRALEYLLKITEENGDSLNLSITGGCGNKVLRMTAYSTLNNGIGNAIAVIPPGTCSWDTAAPTSILFASMAKFGVKGKVTDMFGGNLVYNSSGKIVENDLGAFISCGEKAVEYHEKLVTAMRGDKIILDSLLRKYWNNFDNNNSSGGVDKDEEETRLKLKNAQVKPQEAHLRRNGAGYIINCDELQSLVSNQKDVKGSKLIGYAMPSDSTSLHLFWRRGKDSKMELPDVVQLKKTNSSVEVVL